MQAIVMIHCINISLVREDRKAATGSEEKDMRPQNIMPTQIICNW